MALTAPDSEVDICNLALQHLKQKPITSIDPPATQVENLCSLWYHQIRQETLRSHPWNFALARVQITPDATDPDFGYEHRYELPSDWLRYIGRYDDFNVLLSGEYDIEGGFYLFSGEDDEAINLRYITDFTDVAGMDALFRGLFAVNLAIVLAPNFSGSEARVTTLLALQKDMRAMATAIDGQERPPRRIQDSKFIRARRGGSSGNASPFTQFS